MRLSFLFRTSFQITKFMSPNTPRKPMTAPPWVSVRWHSQGVSERMTIGKSPELFKSPNIPSWTSQWFHGVSGCPYFIVKGENMKVLLDPSEFYLELKERTQKATKRIVLASLYLGNGQLERQLVDCIYNRLQESQSQHSKLLVHILVDYTRGSRGKVNSRTLLLPLLRDFPQQTSVSLYHTPNLRGLLKAIVPERFNETIGVTHLKVYMFDNCLIMSGANLSNDYFTDRQDRYLLIEDCPDLCDYFQDLVETVGKFSLALSQNDTVTMSNDFPAHPFLGPRKEFVKQMKDVMKNFIERYAERKQTSLGSSITSSKMIQMFVNNELENYSTAQLPSSVIDFEQPKVASESSHDFSSSVGDTIVFPMLQMRDIDLRQDELVTLNMFKHSPSDIDIVLATAYFNLTKRYWNVIRHSSARYHIIMAHPQAMGFYNAPGMAGGVPFAYTHLAKQFYQDIIKDKKEEQIVFMEYLKQGWTFHGKGLWSELGSSNNSPFLTLIGSPNFGYRSVYRDLEAQLLIVTKNERLKAELRTERDRFVENSCRVYQETYEGEDRRIALWVFLIATFMRSFF